MQCVHSPIICLKMSSPNGHVHTLHNEMTSRGVETTCGAEQVRGHRKAVLEVPSVERGHNCQSSDETVRCMGRINSLSRYSSTTVKRSCVACYRVLCKLFKAHMFELWALNNSSCEKVASSQISMELSKFTPAKFLLINHCANTTRREWSSGCYKCTLCR